jgi:Domain of unknown function (DUF4157)
MGTSMRIPRTARLDAPSAGRGMASCPPPVTTSPQPAGRARPVPSWGRWVQLRPSSAAARGTARPSAVPARPVRDALGGPGQPLAAPLRREMESRLGADLSDVRVHAGPAARASAAAIGARAYTSGSHVVIGDGGADKRTLAHELAHVLQQRAGPVAGTDRGDGLHLSDPGDRFERAAETRAARAMSGSAPAAGGPAAPAARAPGGPPIVQRAGRHQDLGTGTPVIKVIIAGSSFDMWLTHIQKQEKWERQDETSEYSEPAWSRSDKVTDAKLKPQLSFAGPGASSAKYYYRYLPSFGGLLDIGSNSIENLVRTVPSIIKKVAADEQKKTKTYPTILLKAHSRGAVAAARVVKVLTSTYEGQVELVLFDPVAGFLHGGENQKLDLDESLARPSEFTLVYSTSTGYALFTPIAVSGAKRIIISSQDHQAGLAAGFRYRNTATGQVAIYKGSRLNSLPPGTYVDINATGKNSNLLVPVRNASEAEEKLDQAFKQNTTWVRDAGRMGVARKILDEYFRRASSKMKTISVG